MAWGWDGDWRPYVSVAEKRLRGLAAAKKLMKKGLQLSPVELAGRQIASTFWGKAWCDNLESYRDYENRLPRGSRRSVNRGTGGQGIKLRKHNPGRRPCWVKGKATSSMRKREHAKSPA